MDPDPMDPDPIDSFLNGVEKRAGSGDEWMALIFMDGTIKIGDEEITEEELDRRLDEAPPPRDGVPRVLDFRTPSEGPDGPDPPPDSPIDHE